MKKRREKEKEGRAKQRLSQRLLYNCVNMMRFVSRGKLIMDLFLQGAHRSGPCIILTCDKYSAGKQGLQSLYIHCVSLYLISSYTPAFVNIISACCTCSVYDCETSVWTQRKENDDLGFSHTAVYNIYTEQRGKQESIQ